MANISVAKNRFTRSVDTEVLDLANARLSQGIAILNILEAEALAALQENRGFECGMQTTAEAIWAAKELFVQAKEAMRAS